ncbi:MAG: hypothetical protein EWM50_03965 [Gottschalkiaceae bacterium]|nr:MAG: hypothetical protein EWM50_03965 [Gottschalkiaceae bacterium]
MSQLELLWRLQQHDNRLAQLLLKLKEIENEKRMDDLKVRLKQVEYDITHRKTQKEVDEVKIQRASSKLEQMTCKLSDVEKKLYDGSVSDLKQLTFMSKESQEIKKESIKLEKDILNLMEETEKLEQELNKSTSLYNALKGEMEKNIEEYKAVAERLKLKIKKEKAALEIILSKLDEEQKIKYSTLKEKKGKVVAEVIDGKCRGCHITIPLFIMCKLKNKDEITYCDNCGRILYYREQGYINTVKTNA